MLVGAVYAAVRMVIRRPFGEYMSIASMFVGASWLSVRLTAVGQGITFAASANSGSDGAFKIEGYWRGIDTVKDVQEASAELLSGGV